MRLKSSVIYDKMVQLENFYVPKFAFTLYFYRFKFAVKNLFINLDKSLNAITIAPACNTAHNLLQANEEQSSTMFLIIFISRTNFELDF